MFSHYSLSFLKVQFFLPISFWHSYWGHGQSSGIQSRVHFYFLYFYHLL